MELELNEYNDAIQSWGEETKTRLQATGKSMGIEHRKNSPSNGESLTKIKTRYKAKAGDINQVSFGNINRSLIYTTKGAGNGIGGLKGSRWVDKYGNKKKTLAASLGKQGTGGRTEKPFIDATLDAPAGLEALGDIAAEHIADAVINSVYLK